MTSRFAPHFDWRQVVVAASLVVGLWPARARAEEQVKLEWDAPPECPQEAAVRQKLRTLAGDAWHTTERVSAKGRIELVNGRYRLTVSVRDGDAVKERTIQADSCVDLAGAAVVTFGLLLGRGASSPGAGAGTTTPGADPTPQGGGGTDGRGGDGEAGVRTSGAGAAGAKPGAASRKNTPKGASKEQDEDADPEGRDARSRSSAAGPSEARRFRLLLRAPLLTLDVLRLPKPSLGFGAGLGARYDEWRFVATGRVLAAETLRSDEFPDVGSRVSRLNAELSICRGFRDGSLELAPCLTVGLDHLTARGTGPPNIVRRTQRSVSVLLGGAVAAHYYVADWMALFAGGGLAVATSNPTLSVEGLGEVGHVGPVQVSAGIGSEWIF